MSAGGMIPGAIDAREHDLLGRLGLDERATPEDVARTRDELQAFLAAAPKSIRGWARRQASAADEAYVLLSDPTARGDAGALLASPARSASPPDGPATPPVRRATPAAVPAAAALDASEGDEDAEFEAMLAEVTPSMHRDRIAARPSATVNAALKVPAASPRRKVSNAALAATPSRVPRILAGLAALAGLAVVVVVAIFVIYQFGATPPVTGAQSTPAPTAALDEAKVAELMARIQADPNDTEALFELGDAFFQAQDFATAVTWLEKLVDLEPNNVRGRLALGAAQFNLGDSAAAETQWVAVLDLEADNVEAHYDLGFLYLNEIPPDYDGVQREWSEVVRLDPDSDIAGVVQQHLDALAAQSAAPSTDASAAPSSAPTTSPSAEPTAAPTAAPSGSVAP
jgi:cytochrome c-type biogenesis protein CcmH/NrfG